MQAGHRAFHGALPSRQFCLYSTPAICHHQERPSAKLRTNPSLAFVCVPRPTSASAAVMGGAPSTAFRSACYHAAPIINVAGRSSAGGGSAHSKRLFVAVELKPEDKVSIAAAVDKFRSVPPASQVPHLLKWVLARSITWTVRASMTYAHTVNFCSAIKISQHMHTSISNVCQPLPNLCTHTPRSNQSCTI